MAAELPPFDVQVVSGSDQITLQLTGELDYGTVGLLESTLSMVALEHPSRELRIDLRDLEFIDSAGISALITANADARRRGAGLKIVRGSERVQRPLEVVGMEQIVEFVDG